MNMSKFALVSVVLLCLLLASPAGAVTRVVLAEMFTNIG